MEQAKRGRAHLERLLLVCGDPNAGKSRLLRHMLGDPRLGGVVPASARVSARPLSRERALAVRFTSPHEMKQSPAEFHRRIDRATELAWRGPYWRINYACAVQPRAANRMPGIVSVCDGLIKEFRPERLRVLQLAPDRANSLSSQLSLADVDSLRKLDVEVLSIDARSGTLPVEPANVRALADFFDFS